MQLDEDTQSWLTHRNMSWSIRVTRQAFCRTDWLAFFLKIWFQEHTHHTHNTHTHTHTTHTHTHTHTTTHTKPNRYAISRNAATTGWSISKYTLSLFTISMFFLYIFNNYFNKYFRFHKDTNVVVQMLQAFQVSEPTIPTQHIPQTTNMVTTDPFPKTVYTRQISKSSDFWLRTYVRIPYIERLVLPTFFTKYTLLSPCDVTNPFCEIYTSEV